QVQPAAAPRGGHPGSVRRDGGDRAMSAPEQPDPAIERFLRASGLLAPGAQARYRPLPGGEAFDIWRVGVADGGALGVRGAVRGFKGASHGEAPGSRDAAEGAWIGFAARHLPEAVPRPLAHDPAAGLFAIALLEPQQYPVWKQQLLEGRVE